MMEKLRRTIENAMHEGLPGESAHSQMMNYSRQTTEDVMKKNIPHRVSAVLILCYPKGDQPHFLLLKRHDYDGPHSGQVGLPGGKAEAADADLMATALRECKEESGVEVARTAVVGKLSPIYIPPSNFIVHPFIGLVEESLDFKYDEYEVKFGIEVPFSDLMDADAISESEVLTPKYGSLKVKGFHFDGELVWGATSMILMELRTLIEDQLEG